MNFPSPEDSRLLRYDYFCCPQGTSREATLKRQMAIDSIQIYVVTWYEVLKHGTKMTKVSIFSRHDVLSTGSSTSS